MEKWSNRLKYRNGYKCTNNLNYGESKEYGIIAWLNTAFAYTEFPESIFSLSFYVSATSFPTSQPIMMFKMFILTFLLSLFHQTSAFNNLSVNALAVHFTEILSPTSQIWLPGSVNYTSAITQRWTIYPPAEPTYIIALKPALPSDIQAIVSCICCV